MQYFHRKEMQTSKAAGQFPGIFHKQGVQAEGCFLLNTFSFMPPCKVRKESANMDKFMSLQITRYSLVIGG